MEMFGVAINVRSFVNTPMKQWNTELTASNKRFGNVKIKCGIFQGDSLSPTSIFIDDDTIDIGAKVDKGILQIKEGR